jgi:hypothetical protein
VHGNDRWVTVLVISLSVLTTALMRSRCSTSELSRRGTGSPNDPEECGPCDAVKRQRAPAKGRGRAVEAGIRSLRRSCGTVAAQGRRYRFNAVACGHFERNRNRISALCVGYLLAPNTTEYPSLQAPAVPNAGRGLLFASCKRREPGHKKAAPAIITEAAVLLCLMRSD